jgi:hypothetical protein
MAGFGYPFCKKRLAMLSRQFSQFNDYSVTKILHMTLNYNDALLSDKYGNTLM